MVLSVAKTLEHQIVEWLLNSKLKWMQEEVIMYDLWYSVRTCLDVLRNSTLFVSRLRYQPGTSVIQITVISLGPSCLVMWAFRHSKVLHQVYWNAVIFKSFMLQCFGLGLVRNGHVMLFDVAAAWWTGKISRAYLYHHNHLLLSS